MDETQVTLTLSELRLLTGALRIAVEDGSIYGALKPGDRGHDVCGNQINALIAKLTRALEAI